MAGVVVVEDGAAGAGDHAQVDGVWGQREVEEQRQLVQDGAGAQQLPLEEVAATAVDDEEEGGGAQAPLAVEGPEELGQGGRVWAEGGEDGDGRRREHGAG